MKYDMEQQISQDSVISANNAANSFTHVYGKGYARYIKEF